MNFRMRHLLVIVATLLLIAMCLGVGWMLTQGLTDEINLPLLAISGVVVIIAVLALVAVGFSMVNLSDRTEALGLPSGSVRGVIALSLVVLFAILSVFLFSALNAGGQATIAACLTGPERNEMIRALGAQQVVGSMPSGKTETGAPCPQKIPVAAVVPPIHPSPAPPPCHDEPPALPAGGAETRASGWSWCLLCWWGYSEVSSDKGPPPAAVRCDAPKQPDNIEARQPVTPAANAAAAGPRLETGALAEQTLYSVYVRQAPNQASTDFAKQLLVLIGTLVTSVASFYFGTKAVADAQATATGSSGPPSLHGVTPNPLPRSGEGPVTLTLTGSNLNDVKRVHLEAESRRIDGSNVVSNAEKVQADVMLDEKSIGRWDVVVTDAVGRTARLSGPLALQVTPPSDTGPPPAGRSRART